MNRGGIVGRMEMQGMEIMAVERGSWRVQNDSTLTIFQGGVETAADEDVVAEPGRGGRHRPRQLAIAGDGFVEIVVLVMQAAQIVQGFGVLGQSPRALLNASMASPT